MEFNYTSLHIGGRWMPTTDLLKTRTAKMKSFRNKADVAQRQRIAQLQLSTDFLDHALEWRRIFAETRGTFLLVVVAAGSEVVAARSDGAVTPGMRAVAPGLMVMAIIYFMSAVSGAHLNPAVTLAFAVRRNFPWSRVPGYVLGQAAGGVLAALFLRVMFGRIAALGATVPGSGIGNGKAWRWKCS
jgi:aquaporin Z